MRTNINLFLIIIIIVSNLFISMPVNADNISAYKSKSEEECLNERACVWAALNQFLHNDHHSKSRVYKTIEKWKAPIIVRVMPQSAPETIMLKSITDQIRPYYQFPIEYKDSGGNFVVIFSDDLNKDIFVNYRTPIEIGFGQAIYKMLSPAIPADDPELHWFLHTSEKGRYFFMSFIKRDSFTSYTTAFSIFNLLGFDIDSQHVFPFSGLAAGEKNFEKLSDLDLFLVMLLYDDAIQDGTSIDSVKPIFEKIYDKDLALFKIKR